MASMNPAVRQKPRKSADKARAQRDDLATIGLLILHSEDGKQVNLTEWLRERLAAAVLRTKEDR